MTAERGAAALVTLLVALSGLAAGVGVLGFTLDLAAANARARSAADAAALAAAATSPLVAGPTAGVTTPRQTREAAAQVASANGAQLEDIDLTGWPLRVSVRVSVRPQTRPVHRFTGEATAGATAGVRPRAVPDGAPHR